ncbi:hypothetical protein DFJ58DRAFT_847135 [Suillus subalutaceus]|uniref:uncharacterized protein n=1 Tax=Suillus subalutaceus TaxID=48586 RepID=UPI001B8728FF|nr:uncharacterized protein DFJ58DRAFT_847135 [Suillus subalutaceus]KAG1836143.1 hypothetical protein DFJ58DRAFT_847135 [Suillus subalutaceus]
MDGLDDLLNQSDDIELKFGQCRKCWRKAQPLSLGDGTHKTMQQVGDRLVDQTNERLRLARVLTCRMTIVWVYLQSMMENLGKDGMSSDESQYCTSESMGRPTIINTDGLIYQTHSQGVRHYNILYAFQQANLMMHSTYGLLSMVLELL